MPVHPSLYSCMLTERVPDCAMCLSTKASCINIVIGWLLPTVMTFGISSHMARISYTYQLPPLNEFRAFTKVGLRTIVRAAECWPRSLELLRLNEIITSVSCFP